MQELSWTIIYTAVNNLLRRSSCALWKIVLEETIFLPAHEIFMSQKRMFYPCSFKKVDPFCLEYAKNLYWLRPSPFKGTKIGGAFL